MQHFTDVVQDVYGNAITNAVITVTKTSDGTLASLFSDNGVTRIANPLSVSSGGNYGFYAANGTYNISITALGFINQTVTSVVLFDPVDAGVSSSDPSLASAINFSGAGVVVTPNGSKVDVYIPGSAAQVDIGEEQTADFTLASGMLSSLIPVGAGVNVTVDLIANSGLAVGYSVILMQDGVMPFTVVPVAGVTIDAPNGLTSIGQYTTCALIQTRPDVWLLTIAGASTGGSTGSTGSTGGVANAFEVLPPPNQSGVLLVGGGNGTGTFVQAANTYTVTLVGHGFTAALHNGMDVVVPRLFADPAMYNWGAVWYDVGSNFLYIDANTFSMTVTSSATASGAIGQTNTYYKYPLRQFTIPANTLGANGALRISAGMSQNGTENVGGMTPANHNKYLRVELGPPGGSSIDCGVSSGNSVSGGSYIIIQNRNSASKQAWRTGYGAQYSSGGNSNYITVDTTVDQVLTIFGQMDDSTDWMVLDYALVERFAKD